MMIDPDIEACHELRCTLLWKILNTDLFFLACRGWWQAEGNRTSLKALSVQVSMVTMVTMATMATIIVVSFKKLLNWV